MRATLLMLPLALILSATAFAEPSDQPAPLTRQQLEEAIFSATAANTSTASFSWWGSCSHTCDPCWTSEDCPLMDGGWRQSCVWLCY